MIDINETVPALNGIKPGEKVTYYEGNLAADCECFTSTPERAASRYLRSTAMSAWTSGRAHLVQRRLPDGQLHYVATGKGRP